MTTVRLSQLINNSHMRRQTNFVLAYPQAKVSSNVYMLPPEKFTCDAKGLKLDTQTPSPKDNGLPDLEGDELGSDDGCPDLEGVSPMNLKCPHCRAP